MTMDDNTERLRQLFLANRQFTQDEIEAEMDILYGSMHTASLTICNVKKFTSFITVSYTHLDVYKRQ